MQKIGILGGMSFESTLHYCEQLNKIVQQEWGGLNSVRIALSSVNFAEIEPLQRADKWEEAGKILALEAQNIERAGADFLIIATNTMHKISNQITAGLSIPLLHIADATADAIKKDGIQTVGLLGTSYTMEQDFYKSRLEKAGLKVVIPEKQDRDFVNKVIFEELCLGIKNPKSALAVERMISSMDGIEGVILGCTELDMIVKQAPVKIYDTTDIHVRAAAARAMGKERD